MPRKPYEGEKRESRISIIVVPSLYQKAATLADSQGLSVNEFITRLLEKAVEKNASVIEKFQFARQAARESYVDAE